jgi:transposase
VKLPAEQSFTALVGIDWSDKKHDFCLQGVGSQKREFGVVAHRPEAIDQWARALHQRFGGPIAVCLEIAKGPLVHALQRYAFIVLFPVNPAMLAKYREAFVPSRAKDDPTDAEIALELLLRHREELQPLKPQSAAMRALTTLVEQRRDLVGDKTRITNRLCSTLKEYFPQALDWFEDRDTVLFCDFLQRWPSLKHVKRARQATLRSFFWEHNLRRTELIEERIHGIRSASALTDDGAVIGPHQLLVQALVAQLRVTLQAIDGFDAEITAVAKRLPDYALFAALPGAGAILAPRLLVAFGEHRERYASASQLQQYAGWHPSWSAAETSAGSIGEWPAQPSCVRPSSNGRAAASRVPSGRAPITSASATREALTRPPCEPWLTNGFASSIAAGRAAPLTMNPLTCLPSSDADRL